MAPSLARSAGEGLERLCGHGDWLRAYGPIGGIELLQAHFSGRAYAKHRHDTYAIGLTEFGVFRSAFGVTPGRYARLHTADAAARHA